MSDKTNKPADVAADIPQWHERTDSMLPDDIQRAMKAEINALRARLAALGATASKQAILQELVDIAQECDMGYGATAETVKALTDERIDTLARQANLDGSMVIGSRSDYWRKFARLIETESAPTSVGGDALDAARLERALRAIAEFPITDAGNMDSWNLQDIAKVALAIAAWNRRAAPASEPAVDRDSVPVGYVNLETGDFAFGFYQNKIPPNYFAVTLATPAAPEVPAPAASDHFYTFSKPAGWINLTDPGQSWEQWTKAQGLPTTRGWKVAGVDPAPQGAQAQPVPEPEMNPACGCMKCNPKMISRMMFLCATCGNKRCPHATDHRHACTNSNEPGQVGSAYGIPERATTSKSIEGGEA